MWNYFDNFTPFFHNLQSHLVPSFMFVKIYVSIHSSYSSRKGGKFQSATVVFLMLGFMTVLGYAQADQQL